MIRFVAIVTGLAAVAVWTGWDRVVEWWEVPPRRWEMFE
jgi:hypothetical protein